MLVKKQLKKYICKKANYFEYFRCFIWTCIFEIKNLEQIQKLACTSEQAVSIKKGRIIVYQESYFNVHTTLLLYIR